MISTPNNGGSSPEEPALQQRPAVGEHGVSGTTSDAVGGFGESYDAQVAHGSGAVPRQAEAESALADQRLERALRKTLGRAHADAKDLRIEVQEGRVTLRGSVRLPLEKLQIEARVRALPGVLLVTNDLQVTDPPSASDSVVRPRQA